MMPLLGHLLVKERRETNQITTKPRNIVTVTKARENSLTVLRQEDLPRCVVPWVLPPVLLEETRGAFDLGRKGS